MVFSVLVLGASVAGADDVLQEQWTSGTALTFRPPALILGDAGTWLLADIPPRRDECGPTQNRATISGSSGRVGDGRSIEIVSVDSDSDCGDGLVLAFQDFSQAGANVGFVIPLTPRTLLSFEAITALVEPRRFDVDACFIAPCGDAISIMLIDTRRNGIRYILDSGMTPDQALGAPKYQEIFIAPESGVYTRNLFDDFSSLSGFNAEDAAVEIVQVEVREHGSVTFDNLFVGEPPQDATDIVAALLPGHRSVVVGQPATVFATIVNAGTLPALGCRVALDSDVPVTLTYQPTDPVTNTIVGAANVPVDIPGRGSRSFVLGATAREPFTDVDVALSYDCDNTRPAPVYAEVNTLGLNASAEAGPDVIALAATASGDGTAVLEARAAAFAVSSINIGTPAILDVVVDSGPAKLPVTVTVCRTNAQAQCIAPARERPSYPFAEGGADTFSIFVTADAGIAFDPVKNRLWVRFVDAAGVVRGATSVALHGN